MSDDAKITDIRGTPETWAPGYSGQIRTDDSVRELMAKTVEEISNV
jgi:hypothetical protein